MRIKSLYVLFCVGILVIFYFSWTSSPRLGTTGFLPKWVTDWTDVQQNETIRTAIPFLFVGLLTGMYLTIRKLQAKHWAFSFLILLFVVCLAEFGQLFLPMRNCDILDILWGAIGSGFGLLFIYLFKNAFGK